MEQSNEHLEDYELELNELEETEEDKKKRKELYKKLYRKTIFSTLYIIIYFIALMNKEYIDFLSINNSSIMVLLFIASIVVTIINYASYNFKMTLKQLKTYVDIYDLQ